MKRRRIPVVAVLVLCSLAAVLVGLLASPEDTMAVGENRLVIYCGRSRSLVEPIIAHFERETGVKVDVRYDKTAQLALVVREEGDSSDADVFWAQDAGALGALSEAGMFARYPQSIIERVDPHFRNPNGYWVATSGRARVLAYSPTRLRPEQLPTSVFDLADPQWAGRVGWAPTNGSFIAFVTAMRKAHGEKQTRAWLEAMKDNGAKAYAKNTLIIKAIAAGEVDLGLPNHYYLLRFKKADSEYPVEQQFFAAGDVGNLVNVAGAGVLKGAGNPAAAERFVTFLLSLQAQQYFTSELFEYPIDGRVIINRALVKHEQLLKLIPKVQLDALADLDTTLKMLKEVELR